jgi:hypothetical protein
MPTAPELPPEERAEVLAAIIQLDKRGGRLARKMVQAYEQARRDLYYQLGATDPTPLTASRLNGLMAQVDERLGRLYAELSSLAGAAIVETFRKEGEAAVRELKSLPIPESLPAPRYEAVKTALNRIDVNLATKINNDMVSASVQNTLSKLKAVDAELKAAIRGELTNAMIQGHGAAKAAKAVMSKGLTLEGIRPVFPTVYARAEAIARTELSRSANNAHLAMYVEEAKDVPGLMVRWSSCLCSRTCGLCRNRLHNQRRRPGQYFTASEGKKRFRGTQPPAHPRCLCRIVAEVVA